MKKRFVLLITLALILVVACVMIFVIFKHEHIVDDKWSYNEELHWKNITCTWDTCKFDIVTEEHCDNDGNLFCDVCGFEMSVPAWDIKWIYSATHHWWYPTFEGGIALGVVYGYGEHVNIDEDMKCDVCGYDFSTNVTPLGVFFSTLPGVEWLGTLKADEVAEIKMIEENSGVAPGSLKCISNSTNPSAIARLLSEFRSLGVINFKGDHPFVPGGQILTVEFVLKDGTKKSFSFNNEIYSDSNGNHYFTMGEIPTFHDVPEYTMHYGFVSYTDKCEIWYEGDDFEPYFLCNIPIDKLEFVSLEYELPAVVSEYPYFIKTEFGTLEFYSNDIFFIVGEGQYYELVGKNLDELIMEATVGYSVTMNDEDWLYEDLQSRYKAGETVSVKIGIAYDVGYMFFVNGERIMPEEHVGNPYWEFVFTMPESDVVIDFKTYKGFLPENYDALYEAFWTNNLDAEYVHIRHYYGEFDSGAIVAMIDSGFYMQVIGKDIVTGVTIHYSDSNRITVLYEGKFYSLLEAYQKGYLTAEDIQTIADLHHNQIIPE